MTVRTATHNDLETLLEFEQKLVTFERPMDSTIIQEGTVHYYDLAKYIDDEKIEVAVAEIDGHVVGSGYAKIKKGLDFVNQDFTGYIGFMFVDSNHRGKGIGKEVLEYLVNWLQSKNMEHIVLEVYAENTGAIEMYKKCGFKNFTHTMKYIGN